MNILGENSLSEKTKLLLDIIFIGGLCIFISLPKSLKLYLNYYYSNVTSKIYFLMLALLVITGALALMVVHEIRKIFKTLQRENPFMMDNVKSLKNIGVYSFAIAFFYIFKIIFFNSLMTPIIAMVFVIAGLFSIVLSEIFNQAIKVKEENDLTI